MSTPRVLALALVGATSAQARLDVRLAADPTQSGPPALVFARQQLPRFALHAAALDVDTGLTLVVDAHGVHVAPDSASLPASVYLQGAITTADGTTVTLACDFDGHETWRGSAPAFSAAPLRDFVACTDCWRPIGRTAWLDIAVLVGMLGTGVETESPLGLMLTLGAAECGELIVRGSTDGDQWVLEGRSRGGLVLPALLTHLAQRYDDGRRTEEQRWIALAFAARDSRREEAAIQLARFHSAASERCLLALLHAPDFARVRAIEALARRGASAALPKMAATSAFAAEHDTVAMAALATLWPACSPEQRRTTRALLAANPALLDHVDRLDQPVRTAGVGGDSNPERGAPLGWSRFVLLVALIGSASVLLRRVLSGPRWSTD